MSKTPLGGPAPISADRHSALVEFEVTGDDLEAQDRIAPSQDVVESVQAEHPDLIVEQFGSVSSQKELNETFTEDLLKAEQLSLPITLLILVIAFGTLVAALVPLLLGFTAVMAAMSLVGDPEPALARRQQRLLGHPADRAGGRRRLLAVLHTPRARGAGLRAR